MTQTRVIDGNTVSFFIPLKVYKRGGCKMVMAPESLHDGEGKDDKGEINTNLLNALVRAALWDRRLKSRKYAAMKDLCEAERITRKYVQLILRLNFLAPDIKEAILKGRQPRAIKLIDMRAGIPLLWEEQRELFKFEAK